MNPNKTIATIDEQSLQKAARIAGFMYLIIIITSLLSMVFGPFKLLVKGDDTATFNNIKSNELIFRIGTAYDLIMYASVVILSLALFAILNTVNRNLALLALIWRVGEAILGCLSVLIGLVILLFLKDENYPALFGADKMQALVGILLDIKSDSTSIVFVFLSLGTIINCYLFFKSKYIPGVLAAFGIFSFLLMLIWAITNIIIPISSLMAFGVPAILFEIIIGLWLLFKGVRVEK